jgi:hypothetical protein
VDVYKRSLLDMDVPRRGDLAEVRCDHHKTETGLIVHVVNDPHYNRQYCHECGEHIDGYFVEVVSPAWDGQPGPHFYPVKWLKRIDPKDYAAVNARLDRQLQGIHS